MNEIPEGLKDKAAKRLFKNAYDMHSFCKANPECFMHPDWDRQSLKVKQNYLNDTTQLLDLIIPAVREQVFQEIAGKMFLIDKITYIEVMGIYLKDWQALRSGEK